MSVYSVGRLCMKLAGRDAGKPCVVVEQVDASFVVVDGATRRRKVNINHLEPLEEMLDIGSGSHDDVKAAFAKLGVEIKETKSKKAGDRPRKVRKTKEKKAEVAEKKPAAKKKAVKKTSEKKEETAKN